MHGVVGRGPGAAQDAPAAPSLRETAAHLLGEALGLHIVGAGCEEDEAPIGGEVQVEVADNGQGIAPAAREKLFQAFAGTAKAGGTGLGLAISRDLIKAHGGDIRLVESRPGSTRFRLTLPARERAAAE